MSSEQSPNLPSSPSMSPASKGSKSISNSLSDATNKAKDIVQKGWANKKTRTIIIASSVTVVIIIIIVVFLILNATKKKTAGVAQEKSIASSSTQSVPVQPRVVKNVQIDPKKPSYFGFSNDQESSLNDSHKITDRLAQEYQNPSSFYDMGNMSNENGKLSSSSFSNSQNSPSNPFQYEL